jgi:salicylate hydroxylase
MRIAIIGLGLGGSSAAAALLQYGLDVKVFEQAPEIKEVGAGIASSPPTIRLLARLGIEEKLAAIGAPAYGTGARNKAGEVLHELAPRLPPGAKPGYFFHRAELLETIASVIPRDRIKLGQRCVAVREDADRVELKFENGSSESFDLVIGADGIKSVTLGSVVPPAPPKFSNLVAYRGLISNDELKLTDGYLWTDQESYFVAYPVSSGKRVNFSGFVPTNGLPEESWFAQGDRNELIDWFKTWDPLIGRIVSAVDTTFRWGLYYRDPLPHITSRRIALMGDAAHPMLPAAGSGAAQAIEDAFALAELLRDCTAAQVPERLKIYEKLRLPRASKVQGIAIHNAQFMHKTFPVEPGKERPNRSSLEMGPMMNYDVVAEAQKSLKEGAA